MGDGWAERLRGISDGYLLWVYDFWRRHTPNVPMDPQVTLEIYQRGLDRQARKIDVEVTLSQ